MNPFTEFVATFFLLLLNLEFVFNTIDNLVSAGLDVKVSTYLYIIKLHYNNNFSGFNLSTHTMIHHFI